MRLNKFFIAIILLFITASQISAYLLKKIIIEEKVLEQIEYGYIDWSEGKIEVEGQATPPQVIKNKLDRRLKDFSEKYAPDKATARLTALKKADEIAIRNLTSAVYNIRIKDNYYIKNYINISSNNFVYRLNNFIQENKKKSILYNRDGTISVKFSLNLFGTNSLLSIINETDTNFMTFDKKNFEVSKSTNTLSEDIIPQEYTSLIIDATDIKNLIPSLCPEIFDEKNNIIYNSSYVIKESAETKGIVKFISSHSIIPKIDFVDEKSFMARAIAAGKDNTSVILDTSTIKQLFSSTNTFKHLKKCNVIIIMK